MPQNLIRMEIKLKIQFELVELQIIKMQEAANLLTATNDIAHHCEQMMDFIVQCGWNLDDYTAHLMGWNQGN